MNQLIATETVKDMLEYLYLLGFLGDDPVLIDEAKIEKNKGCFLEMSQS